MKVTLIGYTGQGPRRSKLPPYNWEDDFHGENAIDLLIFTKSTRLTMSPGLLGEIAAWPLKQKIKELEYMANTIPSSWEFVDYTFMVESVTRAFTHQFVRSRQFSFAQQTMRVLNVSEGEGMGWDYLTGPSIESDDQLNHHYDSIMDTIDRAYKHQISNGAKIEDARGLLPTNILTNIIGKCNMRTFVELVRKRSSPRTQSEYRDVLESMKAAVRQVHPWIDLFIERNLDNAIAELQKMINEEILSNEARTNATKLLDQIRVQA